MSQHVIGKNANESPVKRPRTDIHEGSSRARRKNQFAHRSLMQRFIPFAEEEQRRERRSSSRASLPLMPTPPTTPIPATHPAMVRGNPRPIQDPNVTQIIDPADELDLSSDEDDMLTAEEGSDSSNSDSWSSATESLNLSRKPAGIQAPPSSPQLVEEEPMDISQDDCVEIQPEPMRLESFQGLVPKMENVEPATLHDGFSDCSDEEIARVFDDGSDSESLYSWSSSSSNGRVNRPGRHAESVLDNRPFPDDIHGAPLPHLRSMMTAPMPYALPQSHVPMPPAYVQAQPQVQAAMSFVQPQLPQVHPQLPTLPPAYAHPQMQPELNGNCAPLDLAIQSKYNLQKAPNTPSSGVNHQELQPRRKIKRPFEAPYHLGDMAMSQMEYQRQQSRSRISRRLASRFVSNERIEHPDVYRAAIVDANEPSHYTRESCCCRCHNTPKMVPVPVNSFAIERFLQEARVSAGPATSYLLIPTHACDLQARTD